MPSTPDPRSTGVLDGGLSRWSYCPSPGHPATWPNSCPPWPGGLFSEESCGCAFAPWRPGEVARWRRLTGAPRLLPGRPHSQRLTPPLPGLPHLPCRRRTAQRVKRAIVAPDEEITPGFEVVTIVTRDQKTVSGLERFFDNFSARLIDSSGNERTYLRDEVVSMRREMRSLMPANYGQIFSDAELDDLVAYIMGLRSQGSSQ